MMFAFGTYYYTKKSYKKHLTGIGNGMSFCTR
jgi:hypothetical protein